MISLFAEKVSAEEIHKEFDTAQERLLALANEVLGESQKNTLSELSDVASRLEKLGFTKVAGVAKVKSLRGRIVESSDQAKLIYHYKQKYPFLKFLTEEELDRICDKYNLIYAPVSHYIKSVPKKNLEDIERAQPLDYQDAAESYCIVHVKKFWRDVPEDYKKFIKENVIKIDLRYSDDDPSDYLVRGAVQALGFKGRIPTYSFRSAEMEKVDKSKLFIAATPDHFDLKGLNKKKQKGYFSVTRTIVNDPIVFRFVRGGIQVLTKWGKEANDELLALDIDN